MFNPAKLLSYLHIRVKVSIYHYNVFTSNRNKVQLLSKIITSSSGSCSLLNGLRKDGHKSELPVFVTPTSIMLISMEPVKCSTFRSHSHLRKKWLYRTIQYSLMWTSGKVSAHKTHLVKYMLSTTIIFTSWSILDSKAKQFFTFFSVLEKFLKI